MKLKKTLLAMLTAVTTVAVAGSLAACGETTTPSNPDGDKPPVSGGINTYTIEAEYIDIENVVGSGLSSEQSGYEMIYGDGTDAQKALGWSGGYYVGYTYTSECEMEFVFDADKATTGTIVVRLGSELGNIMLTPSAVSFTLNGATINYGSLSLQNSDSMAEMKFKDCQIAANAAIKHGENKLVMKINQNTLRGSSTGGPTIDCVKITTDAVITYDAKTDNPSKRGAI